MLAGFSQARIAATKVLVIGAGTTGNEIIKNLALLGVGTIDICDNDIVEEVNLILPIQVSADGCPGVDGGSEFLTISMKRDSIRV